MGFTLTLCRPARSSSRGDPPSQRDQRSPQKSFSAAKSSFQSHQHFVQHLFRITEQHAIVVFVEERVVDARIARWPCCASLRSRSWLSTLPAQACRRSGWSDRPGPPDRRCRWRRSSWRHWFGGRIGKCFVGRFGFSEWICNYIRLINAHDRRYRGLIPKSGTGPAPCRTIVICAQFNPGP